MSLEDTMTACFVMDQNNCNAVKSPDPNNPSDPARVGPLYAAYGDTKGYGEGEQINPIRRSGGGALTGGGNLPDPCFILVKSSILNDDDLATAAGYLVTQAASPGSGVIVLDSLDDDFPGVYVPPPG